MLIKVQTFGDWDFFLEVDCSYSVQDIISRVKEVLKANGRPDIPLKLILLFEGTKLDPESTIGYWNMREGSVIQAVYQIGPPTEESLFIVRVKLVTGELTKMEIKPTDHVWNIRGQISAMNGCSSFPHRIMYEGRFVHDDERVIGIGLRAGDTITVVLEQGGGPSVIVWVKTLTGIKREFGLRWNDDVYAIKERIRHWTGVEIGSFIVEGEAVANETSGRDLVVQAGQKWSVALCMCMVRRQSVEGSYVVSLEGTAVK